MSDKPIGPNGPQRPDVSDKDQRLRGPAGLYDSPNYDRNTGGGIIQRVATPAGRAPEQTFGFDMFSLNDSDTKADMLGADSGEDEGNASGDLQSGTAFRRSITGSNM